MRAATVPASIPAIICFRDCFFALSRVHGSSMEPALKDGDILLVRKCDAGSITSLLLTDDNGPVNDDRECAVRYERLQQGLQSGTTGGGGWLASRPPLALPGQVLVYQNPLSVAKEYFIKRVAAVGGQWLRHEYRHNARPDEQFETTRYNYDYRLEALPPHTVYVEGDNHQNSVDSRSTGPISKNLVVGVAEYVVWPPTRWRRIQREPPVDADGKPRAIWY
jgi:signal peptidase I